MSVFEPEHRARRYLKLSFDEYRAAIRSNPYNDKLIDEYVKILTAVEGEIPAKVELALLLQQAGLHDRSNTLLVDIALKDREAATGYIDGLIESSMGPYERAERYRLALKLSPGNGEYWYRLGKLHIGMNKHAREQPLSRKLT